MDTNNKEDDMIESAQDKHIRELEAEVGRLGNFNCELDREVENLKEHLATANYNIGELYGALAATDKLLADIQQLVAQLENHTASQDQINEIHAWFAHLQQRVELCEQAQKGAIFCKPESIIGIVPTQPTYDVYVATDDPTVDELHKRIKDLEEQLSYALDQTTRSPSVTEFKWVCPDNEQTSDLKKQIHQLSYDRDTLAKRLADIFNIAKKDT